MNEHKAIEAKEKNKPLFAMRLLTKKQIPSSANICIFKTPSENAFITYALFQNSDNSNFRIISLTIGETVYPIEHTHFVLKNELFCLVFHVCNKELENIVLKCQDIHHNDYYYKLFLHKMKNEEFYSIITFEEIDNL